MDSNLDMLIRSFADATEKRNKETNFLQTEIKLLITAIRTAPDLESLRVVANQSVERMRKRSLEIEKQRLIQK